MNSALAGRTALVTGASSGIGQATAIAIARAGARVALSARRVDRLEALVEQIQAEGGTALAIAGDVSNEDVARRTVAQTVDQFGALDILVNGAGIIQSGGVEHANLAEWRQIMDVNFFSYVYMCNAALPHMKALGKGDIINISSISGRRSAALFGAYAPSKFAVNAMSEGLRQEVGASNIRVCVIEPGATRTEVAETMSDPQWREMMRQHVSKDGAVDPANVADAIVFVLSLPQNANISELLIRPTSDIAPM